MMTTLAASVGLLSTCQSKTGRFEALKAGRPTLVTRKYYSPDNKKQLPFAIGPLQDFWEYHDVNHFTKCGFLITPMEVD